jgi:biotin synthase
LAESEQAMCFMAGANAVFTGEQMLTTPCVYISYPFLNID